MPLFLFKVKGKRCGCKLTKVNLQIKLKASICSPYSYFLVLFDNRRRAIILPQFLLLNS